MLLANGKDASAVTVAIGQLCTTLHGFDQSGEADRLRLVGSAQELFKIIRYGQTECERFAAWYCPRAGCAPPAAGIDQLPSFAAMADLMSFSV